MSRNVIFSKLRQVTSDLKEKVEYPTYQVEDLYSAPKLEGSNLWEIFSNNFKAVNGKPMNSIAQLVEFLVKEKHQHGYCDPALYDQFSKSLEAAGITVETSFDRERYNDYEFGITRASGVIAESGTLIIDDLRTSDRLAALSPWTHVGVITEDEIIRTIPEAIAQLGESPNTIWCTGPSKTADVEGILIEGVHGPGEQIALLL
jgi:L-lactate dehydrogenase complex protein LldG